MGVETMIEWCHHTWNPVRGCQKISPGCTNCYAEAGSKRNPAVLGEWGPNGARAIAAEPYWGLPFRWDQDAENAGERRRVFCASLADWLEDHPTWDAPRCRLLSTIRTTPHLDWLLLTKRPENWRPLLRRVQDDLPLGSQTAVMLDGWLYGDKPPANVWLGVSVEDQARADERIPAAVRFLSVEPLLGPVRLPFELRCCCGSKLDGSHDHHTCGPPIWDDGGIDWVIVGGESGPNARPCNFYWIKSIVEECKAVGLPVFVKQWGSRPFFDATGGARYDDHTYHKLRDKKGGDPSEWPAEIRVREFPAARAAGGKGEG